MRLLSKCCQRDCTVVTLGKDRTVTVEVSPGQKFVELVEFYSKDGLERAGNMVAVLLGGKSY